MECGPARPVRETFEPSGSVTGLSDASSMQAFGHRGDDSWTSFGQRRGISGPARFGLDLTRTKAESEGVAGPGGYPSPPMSGSPPLPPKTSHDVAERGQGTYQATTQDVLYRGIPATQGEQRTPSGLASASRPFLSGTPERTPYAFPPIEESTARPPPYPRPLGQVAAQTGAYLPVLGPGAPASHAGPLPALQTYPATSPHAMQVSLPNPPAKPQRKTKGHVASACVPCKKAHLRFVYPVCAQHQFQILKH